MIINFSITNFRSIRNEIVLNLTAKKRTRKDGVIANDKYDISILPITALYGANGSGKSNIIDALSFMRSKVLGDRKLAFVPFMFGTKEDEEKPSSFGLLFIAEDGNMYHYGFSIKSRGIESEWLIAYYTKRPSMLFERYKNETGKVIFSFGQQFKKTTENGGRFLSFISQGLPDDCLFIIEAAARGVIACLEVVRWFQNKLVIIPAGGVKHGLNPLFFSDEEYRNRMSERFRSFGFDLNSLSVKEGKLDLSGFDKKPDILDKGETVTGFPRTLGAVQMRQDGEIYELYLRYLHKRADGSEVSMPAESGSGGFRRLLELFSEFDGTSNKVIFIDEIENSLHPLLLEGFIHNVLESNLENSGQLVFVTHDTNILNFDFIRSDEIQFAEKDSEWATHLTGLAEYKDIADLNIENGYLKGRFGAIPMISFDIRSK